MGDRSVQFVPPAAPTIAFVTGWIR